MFIDLSPSSVLVTSTQARDLALIINELATNAAKHGLGERDGVRVSLRASVDGDVVVLKCWDDGPGYPEDVWRFGRYDVGLDMVQRTVGATLRGALSLHNDGGAVTTIRFPAEA